MKKLIEKILNHFGFRIIYLEKPDYSLKVGETVYYSFGDYAKKKWYRAKIKDLNWHVIAAAIEVEDHTGIFCVKISSLKRNP